MVVHYCLAVSQLPVLYSGKISLTSIILLCDHQNISYRLYCTLKSYRSYCIAITDLILVFEYLKRLLPALKYLFCQIFSI